MDFRGGRFTLYADHDYGRRVRDKCNRGRKKGRAKDGGVGLKAAGMRTGAEQRRARWGKQRQEKFEGEAAAGKVEEAHHCCRGWGKGVGGARGGRQMTNCD